MSKRTITLLSAVAAVVAIGTLANMGTASAGLVNVTNASFTDQTANQGGTSFVADNPATGFNAGSAITATFNYTGPIDFDNTAAQNSGSTGDLNSTFFGANASGISVYSGSGTLSAPANANFTNLTTFLASSGSASNFQYGSLYKIDLGSFTAGTVLEITHDDGVSIFQGGSEVGTSTDGPTTVTTDFITVGTGDVTLYYARENGSPSILEVSVPEPTSLALLGTALAGLGWFARRRRKTTV